MAAHEVDRNQIKSCHMFTANLKISDGRCHIKQGIVGKSTRETPKTFIAIKKQTSLQKRVKEKTKDGDIAKTTAGDLKVSKMELNVISLRIHNSNPIKNNTSPRKYTQNIEQLSTSDKYDNKDSEFPNKKVTDHSLKTETLHERHRKPCDIKSNKGSRRQTIKTALVYVGGEDTDLCNRQNGHAHLSVRRHHHKHTCSPNYNGDMEYSREIKLNYNTSDSETNLQVYSDVESTPKKNDACVAITDTKKTVVPVTAILFTPPLNQKVSNSSSSDIDSAILSSNNSTVSASNHDIYIPMNQNSRNPPINYVIESHNTGQISSKKLATSQVKTIRLQVFSERRR